MSVSYFDGIRLSYPLTLRDLGSAYGIAFDFEDDNGNTAYCIDSGFMALQSYAYIKFSPDVSEPSPDARINKLIAIEENISVNGVRKRDGSDAVISALGQPDSIEEQDDNFIHYIYLDRESGSELIDVRIIKAAPHKARLTALHAICLHIFRHLVQKFLDRRQPACEISIQSDEKSDGASYAQALCGVALKTAAL